MKKIIFIIAFSFFTLANAMAGFHCQAFRQQVGDTVINNPDPMPFSALIYTRENHDDTIVVTYEKNKAEIIGQFVGTKSFNGKIYNVYKSDAGFIYLAPANIPAKKHATFFMFQITPVLNSYATTTYGCIVDY